MKRQPEPNTREWWEAREAAERLPGPPERRYCWAVSDAGYTCTRSHRHSGRHAAKGVIAVWL